LPASLEQKKKEGGKEKKRGKGGKESKSYFILTQSLAHSNYKKGGGKKRGGKKGREVVTSSAYLAWRRKGEEERSHFEKRFFSQLYSDRINRGKGEEMGKEKKKGEDKGGREGGLYTLYERLHLPSCCPEILSQRKGKKK